MGEMKCPVTGKTRKAVSGSGTTNKDWWPNQLNLKILRQNSSLSLITQKNLRNWILRRLKRIYMH